LNNRDSEFICGGALFARKNCDLVPRLAHLPRGDEQVPLRTPAFRIEAPGYQRDAQGSVAGFRPAAPRAAYKNRVC
jgi:hypothetical protein